jgi:hypothetical protein
VARSRCWPGACRPASGSVCSSAAGEGNGGAGGEGLVGRARHARRGVVRVEASGRERARSEAGAQGAAPAADGAGRTQLAGPGSAAGSVAAGCCARSRSP